jgi:hypothetical protein
MTLIFDEDFGIKPEIIASMKFLVVSCEKMMFLHA